MKLSVDLDAYFERIGYAGTRAPSLATLQALHALHPAAIAFENLTPFSGDPVALELDALQQKLVRDGRGGYCFEQNALFLAVLRALGFSASGLAARVLWNQPEGAVTARGHMLLRVELAGETWVADVGFGGQTLTAPLRLSEAGAQTTPHEPFRLVRSTDSDFRLESQVRGEWAALYRFDLAPAYAPDYAVSNYFLSTHPESHFRSSLIAARAVPGKRYALMNRKLSVHVVGGETEVRVVESVEELQRVLEDVFGIGSLRTRRIEDALRRLF